MRRALVAAVAALLVLTGCSAGSGGAESGDSAGGPVAEEGSGGGAASDGGDSATDGGEQAVGDEDRQVITSGSVSMSVEDPRAAAGEVAMLVEHVGGFVAEREETAARDAEDADASARLLVRVPSAEVTGTLAQLEELGTVEDVSLSSQDVTATARDLDARIRALEISVGRLEDLLSRSGTIDDLVQAEQVLTERQKELEVLQSERASLADQVEMSTIEVWLWTPDDLPTDPPSGFWGGLVMGWESLVKLLTGVLLTIGVLLPWAALAGLIVLVVVLTRRALGRRRAATALPAVPQPAGVTTAAAQPGAAPTAAQPQAASAGTQPHARPGEPPVFPPEDQDPGATR